MKLGAVTVGQAPRVDLIPDIAPLMSGIEIIEKGALDDFTSEEINKRFAPAPGDTILVSRLRDGSQARFAEKHILGFIQEKIRELEEVHGADAVLMLCTGRFPSFEHKVPVFYPNDIVRHFVQGIASGMRLGAMSPDAGQIPNSKKRWREAGLTDFVNAAASPYGDPDKVYEAAIALKNEGAEILLLDCIGYTTAMKRRIQDATGLPVILPRTVVARAMAELNGQS